MGLLRASSPEVWSYGLLLFSVLLLLYGIRALFSPDSVDGDKH